MEELSIETIPGSSDDVRVVKLTGPFTMKTIFDFQSTIRNDHKPVTIIDLVGVPYMDSAALGSILGFHVSCQRDGRKCALAGASDRLMTLFRVAGVKDILSFAGSVSEAEGRAVD